MQHHPRVALHERQYAQEIQRLPRVNMRSIQYKKVNISADTLNETRNISSSVDSPFVFEVSKLFID